MLGVTFSIAFSFLLLLISVCSYHNIITFYYVFVSYLIFLFSYIVIACLLVIIVLLLFFQSIIYFDLTFEKANDFVCHLLLYLIFGLFCFFSLEPK